MHENFIQTCFTVDTSNWILMLNFHRKLLDDTWMYAGKLFCTLTASVPFENHDELTID
jgi:hypothetical protein